MPGTAHIICSKCGNCMNVMDQLNADLRLLADQLDADLENANTLLRDLYEHHDLKNTFDEQDYYNTLSRTEKYLAHFGHPETQE